MLTLFIMGCTHSNEQIDNVDIQTVQVPREDLPTKGGPKLKAIDCKPEQRNVDGCIEIYQPVCGQVQVQCITTPCDPVKETYENSCKACVNPNVLSYTEGECFTSDNIKR